ncbi:MAG: hypothetical protein GY859_27235, partial [Desulfobacterales bacterium]|nr:hypothetical protein [Desulfobacterales bacterium]
IEKDGRPLALVQGRWVKKVVDLDVLERCLRLEIEVDATENNFSMDLSEWAGRVETAPERLLDPELTRGHPVFGRVLPEAVGAAIGDENFEKASIGKPVLQQLKKEWLLKTVSSLSEEGLSRAGRIGRLLAEKTDVQIYKENPEAYARLCQQKIADALQTTLKGGILDEFGWPGLEEAVLKINPDGKKKIDIGKCAPFIVLGNGVKAVVAGPGGIVFEHDFKTPAGHKFEDARYIDGDLLVIFEKDYSHVAYWAANPDDLFEFEYHYFQSMHTEHVQWPREDGCFFGDRLVRSGRPVKEIEPDDYFTDGEHVWKFDYDLVKDAEVIVEYDFRTGETGRPGMPAFFEDFIAGNRELDPSNSWLYAPGEHASSSPLGGEDGLVGWRVGVEKTGDDIRRVCEGIDGRRTAIEHHGRIRTPRGLMSWPGADDYRLIGGSGYGRFSMWGADGAVEYSDPGESFLHRMGWPFYLPTPFWHNFKPRDLEASKVLRSISKKACAALLAAAEKDLPEGIVKRSEPTRKHFTGEKWPETVRAVQDLFPRKAHPRLVAGILGVVQHAAFVDGRLKKLKTRVKPDLDGREAPDETLKSVMEKGLDLATGKTIRHCRSNTRRLFWLMAIINNDFDAAKVKESYFFETVAMVRTLPLDILPRLFEGKSLDLLADFLDAWIRAGFAAAADRIRLTHASASAAFKPPFPVENISWEGHMGRGEVDGRYYVLLARKPETGAWRLFEFSPDGVFKDLPGLKGHEDGPLGGLWSESDYTHIVRLIREKGRPPISMDALKRFAENTGLSHAEASLPWCGFPGGGANEKDFLSKPLRERLKLKVNEAYFALGNLSNFGGEKLESVLLNMLNRKPPGMETADPETPEFAVEDIWEPDNGRYAARLARIWNGVMGKELKLPADLYEKIQKELDPSISLYQLAEWISDDASPLHADYDWKFAISSRHRLVQGVIPDDPAFENGIVVDLRQIMDNASALIPFLFESLPVGDPFRELIPKLFDLTLSRLSHPGLLVYVGTRRGWEDKEAVESLIRHVAAAGSKTRRVSENKVEAVVYETEAILGIHLDDNFSIAFRPPLVTSERDKAFLLGPGRLDSTRIWRRTEFFLSGRLKKFRDRVADTPAPDGGWENNPLLSAPEVVDKAAASLDLDRDAAALYLQHLALAAP